MTTNPKKTRPNSIAVNDGTKLVFEDIGVADASKTVVLIHGWSGSRRYWDLNVELWAESCRVVTYDQRGHGDSDASPMGHHVARLAMDLREILVQLDCHNCTLVGGSMGCCVIFSYFELFANKDGRVASIVLVDQAPLQNRIPGDWTLGSLGCYDDATLKQLQHLVLTDLKSLAVQNSLSCIANRERVPKDFVELLERETTRCDARGLSQLMRDHTQLDWRDTLPTISVPALNFVGGKSGVFPVEGTMFVGNALANGKNVVFQDSSHWLYIEEPERFSKEVAEFILKQN